MSTHRCPRCAGGTVVELGRTPSTIGYGCPREACQHVWFVERDLDAETSAGARRTVDTHSPEEHQV